MRAQKERFILSSFDPMSARETCQGVSPLRSQFVSKFSLPFLLLSTVFYCGGDFEIVAKDGYQIFKSGKQYVLSIGRAAHLHKCRGCAVDKRGKELSDPDTWHP